MGHAGSLFEADVPQGFFYRREFIAPAEERALADGISRIEFAAFEMRGVIAKRRVAFFGRTYDSGGAPTPPIPEFLFRIRDRAAVWAGVDPSAFAMALVNEYRRGAPIGWHRDAPQYDITAGISLVSSCKMRFRPYLAPKDAQRHTARRMTTHEIELLPRSGYIIAGEARSKYEHSIPAVAALRYSITFRTLR